MSKPFANLDLRLRCLEFFLGIAILIRNLAQLGERQK
jgi:hypothetical protein